MVRGRFQAAVSVALTERKWFGDFLVSAERRGLSPRTIECYRRILGSLTVNYGLDLASCSRERFVQVFDLLRKQHSVPYYTLHLTLAKMVLQHLKRRELAEALEYPQMPDRSETIMAKLLSREDRDKLIRHAPTLQDRLIFELLDETGGRKGELYKLRIKDIQFETIRGQLTAIVQLSGKSGTRRRRIYTSAPDLREQINNHPQRDNPNATILLKRNGEPFTIHAFYHRVHDLGRRILKRSIYPHQFRHTLATSDSRIFTDREMMLLYGWKNPMMVTVYSHLSLRDVDEKDLVLHGLKAREEILKPLMQVQHCQKCKAENAPIALYCCKCGETLRPNETEQVKRLREDVASLSEAVKRLAEGEYSPLHAKD